LNSDNLRTESTVNLTSSNVLTVSMWLYVNEFNNDDAMAFESSVNLNNNDGAAGFTLHSGTPCSGYINVSIQDSTSSSKYRIECFNRPTAKEWHHYVTIYDNSSTQGDVRLFIDGVEQNSVSMPINTKDQASGLGNYTWYLMSRSGTIQYASGRLDDVRVYNRTLSDAEIKSLYNLGAGTKTNTSLSQKNVNSSGLVGHWTFDGSKMTSNVADSSGNGNHGYLQGQISTTTKIGKIGQSIQFDGIDDRVNVPDSSQFTISGPFAVSAWIKMNNASGFRLVSKATIAATQAEWGMGTSGAGSAYYFQLYSGGSAANNCSANVTSAATGDVNTWVHLLVQYSGSGGCGGISIYRNGEIQSVTTVNSGSGFSSFSNTSAPVNIGALFNDDPTYKSYARGLIDDVRIFNRTLSSTEIRQLYLLGN